MIFCQIVNSSASHLSHKITAGPFRKTYYAMQFNVKEKKKHFLISIEIIAMAVSLFLTKIVETNSNISTSIV